MVQPRLEREVPEMTVVTPVYPAQNSTHNVGRSNRDIIIAELHEGTFLSSVTTLTTEITLDFTYH